MSDPQGLLDRYLEFCKEENLKTGKFIKAVLEKEVDDALEEPRDITDLKLPGNNYLLTDTRLVDEDAYILYKVLYNSTYVVTMDLRYNSIGDQGAQYIGKLIQETCMLRALNVMCNDIGEEGAKHIAKALESNETLHSLKMNGNKIGNKGGMYFAGTLQVNQCLEDLDLGDTDLGTECMIALATVLNQNAAIKSLCTNRPLLFSHQEETTIHMAQMLKFNRTLAELHLQKCHIRDFGAERLGEALIENVSLTYLDLSCNRITRDGAKKLSVMLKHNPMLKILDLGFNRIEDDGAIYLSDALKELNSNLTTLVITSNQVNGPGLCAVAKAMQSNQTLTSVFIWGNNLEESACIAFNELVETGRLHQSDTDVKPYRVDGRVYLSELNHGLRRHYYWTPYFGPDVEGDGGDPTEQGLILTDN